jgi:hypothetical protein
VYVGGFHERGPTIDFGAQVLCELSRRRTEDLQPLRSEPLGRDHRYAVIGAGSVVTRDIPAGVFGAGNPCRVIREIAD